MKRLILAVTGTIAGVTALLSFKTQTHPVVSAAALPSASLSTSAAAATPSTSRSAASAAGSATQRSTAASTGSSPSSSVSPAPVAKSYLGSAITTRYGVIQVKITVTDQKITNVQFAQLTAFDGRSEQINSYAGPQLLQETLSAQSANVDTISGASYTSDGYRQSLQSSLDKAGIK